MNRIIDGNSTGKTRKLMEYAQKNKAIFVCANPSAMIRKAAAYGLLDGLTFMNYETFDYQGCIGPFVIDELERYIDFINATASSKFIGYTITNED